MANCYCGLEKEAENCCLPIIRGQAKAQNPEELMRARYSAHCLKDYDFLVSSTHPAFRDDVDRKEIEDWAKAMVWEQLQILNTKDGGANDDTGQVDFCAHYTISGIPQELREDAFFRKEGDNWYYVEGDVHSPEPVRRDGPKIGRNDPCPCGSGKKFKKCCMDK